MPAAAAAKSLQLCPTLCSPPGSALPGILQARTRVGCHFLLQCMKVKSETEVTQSCPTRSDPMGCSPPGSSIHGIFQARVLEWGAIAFFEESAWLLLNTTCVSSVLITNNRSCYSDCRLLLEDGMTEKFLIIISKMKTRVNSYLIFISIAMY